MAFSLVTVAGHSFVEDFSMESVQKQAQTGRARRILSYVINAPNACQSITGHRSVRSVLQNSPGQIMASARAVASGRRK